MPRRPVCVWNCWSPACWQGVRKAYSVRQPRLRRILRPNPVPRFSSALAILRCAAVSSIRPATSVRDKPRLPRQATPPRNRQAMQTLRRRHASRPLPRHCRTMLQQECGRRKHRHPVHPVRKPTACRRLLHPPHSRPVHPQCRRPLEAIRSCALTARPHPPCLNRRTPAASRNVGRPF